MNSRAPRMTPAKVAVAELLAAGRDVPLSLRGAALEGEADNLWTWRAGGSFRLTLSGHAFLGLARFRASEAAKRAASASAVTTGATP